jgi:hypothetical protein
VDPAAEYSKTTFDLPPPGHLRQRQSLRRRIQSKTGHQLQKSSH